MTIRALFFALLLPLEPLHADPTRFLRQPTLSATHVAFAHAGDLWIAGRDGGEARRLTSTPAVETDPHFSPDGTRIAFSSNRAGGQTGFAVYVVPAAGGTPARLTWYPAYAFVRGWTPDGERVLYASTRETAPVGFERLWTVAAGGGPSETVPAPWGHDGWYSPDGGRLAVDRMTRWDREWRHYRGGQNTALTILDLDDLSEADLPHENTVDVQPVWLGETIYFLSDRDWVMNVWAYRPASEELTRLTDFEEGDVKWLSGHGDTLVFERGGDLYTLTISHSRPSGATPTRLMKRLEITVRGDFPWAEPRWQDVGDRVRSASLSPTGQRALFEARGEIFTVPVEKGDTRNLTRSSGAADRAPVWSPDGREIAWFSDSGDGYQLLIAAQDGLGEPRRLGIGESKMVWEATWSPDGSRIAFVDDEVRVQVLEVATGTTVTADSGTVNLERGRMGLAWSPDSMWLAYAKTAPNNLRRIVVWSIESGEARPLTGVMADAAAPAWDRGGRRLYFLASTDVALGSGWANTSGQGADPSYGAYVVVLREDDPAPFAPESDEEPVDDDGGDEKGGDEKPKDGEPAEVRIAFDGLERRIVALPMPVARYATTLAGLEGTVFVGEWHPGEPTLTLHKFSIEEREAEVFAGGISRASVSADGKKLFYQAGGTWHVVDTVLPPEPEDGALGVSLPARLDRPAEWRQIFDEAWRYQRDFFYDPNMHGRDWDAVRERYAPLVPHVRHRADLNVLMDRVNGELAVGHSFVSGGDMPETEDSRVGVLGADLTADRGRWRIERIYTFESWNPEMQAPLDRPGLRVEEGHYLLALDGVELTSGDDPYRLLDGTSGRQTVLRLGEEPVMEGSWTVTVEPAGDEGPLRQRAWVEDNRRRVDELSGGKVAYVWVPSTGGRGVVSFNRYFFAQQDKLGAVIDERFNSGGLLDDYMVDLMTRRLRAAIVNEVPGGVPFRLPAGILGPKVLLINELAGSGGDFLPWVFRQQRAGPLVGARTWGGLVKSAVHYPLVDGGTLTAPDNRVFDPNAGRWIAENEGVAPDVEVRQDARSVAEGRDPQLERAVEEVLRLLDAEPPPDVAAPPYPTPAERFGGP